MKFMIVAISLFFTTSVVLACSCKESPLPHEDAIQAAINDQFHDKVAIDFKKNVRPIKAYPSVIERVDLYRMSGTSCEITGPQGESLYLCARIRRMDYFVTVRSCDFVVRAKSTPSRSSAKVVSAICN